MSFHWSCFIVPSCLEICSFIVILVVSHCFIQSMRKKNKTKKNKKNKKTKKQKTKQKEEKKEKKREKKKIYINKCARICIQYKYSLSSYVDL